MKIFIPTSMAPTLATKAKSPVTKKTTSIVVAEAIIRQVMPFKILRLCDSFMVSSVSLKQFSMEAQLETTWKKALMDEFSKDYFKVLSDKVTASYSNSVVYPPKEHVFNAFKLCPYDQVKVVILGQDPYHGTGQAHGLSFSVPQTEKIPPSLRNIYKEINSDTSTPMSQFGNLEHWATQGVLLLNSILTVESEKPGSHKDFGWEQFTDAVIKKLSNDKTHLVFLLWGSYAHKKSNLIDETKHLILKAPHPSPLSAHRGFFGSKHFSTTNEYLIRHGQSPIAW